VGFALIAIALLLALTANAQTREEWRAVEHRTGATRENACLLLALDLTPSDPPKKLQSTPAAPAKAVRRVP